MPVLVLDNRQKTRVLDLRFLRKITRFLLEKILNKSDYELGFHFVDAEEMASVNQTYLQHEGSTDVISFDHAEGADQLHGEIFICVDDAVIQAKEFKTTWQSEVTRYIVHGTLHLLGYDDLNPIARKKMKAEENRLLDALARKFPLSKVQRKANAK